MNKNVLNKLSKIESNVELGAVRVDLSLMDEINKAISDYNSLPVQLDKNSKSLADTQKLYNTALKDFNFWKDSTQTMLSKYKDSYDTTGLLLNKIRQNAATLGMSVKDIPNYNELEKLHMVLVKSYTSLVDTFNKAK